MVRVGKGGLVGIVKGTQGYAEVAREGERRVGVRLQSARLFWDVLSCRNKKDQNCVLSRNQVMAWFNRQNFWRKEGGIEGFVYWVIKQINPSHRSYQWSCGGNGEVTGKLQRGHMEVHGVGLRWTNRYMYGQ